MRLTGMVLCMVLSSCIIYDTKIKLDSGGGFGGDGPVPTDPYDTDEADVDTDTDTDTDTDVDTDTDTEPTATTGDTGSTATGSTGGTGGLVDTGDTDVVDTDPVDTDVPIDTDDTDVVDTDPLDTDTDIPLDTAIDTDRDDDGWDRPEDCDDDDPAVNPGAEERCGDNIDNDCDPETDCRWQGLEKFPDATVTGEVGRPNFGLGITGGDLTDDGVAEAVASAEDAIYVFDEIVDGVAPAVALAILEEVGETSFAALDVGDLTGDGSNDLVASRANGAFVIPGPITDNLFISPVSLRVAGEDPGDGAGAALSIGDGTGDAAPDLLISAPFHGANPTPARGAVYLLQGPMFGDVSVTNAVATVLGTNDDDEIGHAVILTGDFDGNGTHDAVLTGGTAVRVFNGPLFGAFTKDDYDHALVALPQQVYQQEVLTSGDLNGDGYDDLAAGAPDQAPGGESSAVVAFGPLVHQLPYRDAEVLIWEGNDTSFGEQITLGDYDDDGAVDVIVTQDDGGTSSAFVFYGPIMGFVDAAAESNARIHLPLTQTRRMTNLGDMDEDGREDLFFGYATLDESRIFLGTGY